MQVKLKQVHHHVSDRVAKYNQLLRIEDQLDETAEYLRHENIL